MAAGKNISNLSSTMQLTNNASSLVVEKNEFKNEFKKIVFQKIIDYVNNKLATLTRKYIIYQADVDYIKNSYRYINDKFISCNNNYKDVFNNTHIDKINIMIININKYIDELYAIINKVVPMTDQVVSYMSLITHIEETYKLDDFSNLIKTDGSLDRYKLLLDNINTEINNLFKAVKDNYNNLIDDNYIKKIGNLSNAIEAASNINTNIKLSAKFNITHNVISAYYAELSSNITEISNGLSVCNITNINSDNSLNVYFNNVELNHNLSIQVDSISSITSLSILFSNINDISLDNNQPFAKISVIYN